MSGLPAMGRFHTTQPYLGEKGNKFGEIHDLNLLKACIAKYLPCFDSNLMKRNGKKQGLKEQLLPHNYQLSR